MKRKRKEAFRKFNKNLSAWCLPTDVISTFLKRYLNVKPTSKRRVVLAKYRIVHPRTFRLKTNSKYFTILHKTTMNYFYVPQDINSMLSRKLNYYFSWSILHNFAGKSMFVKKTSFHFIFLHLIIH